MLKFGNIFYLYVLIALISGCKKDPKFNEDPYSNIQISDFNCGRINFSDTLLVSLGNPDKITSSISGSNNIYVATPGTSNLEMVKMNCDANFIWKKNYNYGTEKVVSVSALGKYDDFYVLTSTDNFTVSNGVDTVKAWVSFAEVTSSTTINCDRGVLAYNYIPNFITEQSIVALSNYSRLYKYDGSGNLQWQKNLKGNYYNNEGLCADSSNNIYVLTAERKTFTPFEVFTFTTNAYPSFAMPLDSNGFTVTKIDPFGNQVSSKTINKVYSWRAGSFNPALSVSANQVNVICDREVYVFNLSLGYYAKISPLSVNCVNKSIKPLNNPLVTNSVFHLETFNGIDNIYLFETWNGANKLNSNGYSDQSNIDMSPCMDYKGNIYFARAGFIEKFDSFGSKLYHKTLSFSQGTKTCLTSKMDQVYFINYENSGKLYIIKPDKNGNY